MIKIISGGQTGVDLAALSFAKDNNLPYGGYVPRGRKTEAGPLSDEFIGMIETQSFSYIYRTELNIMKSDVTVVFVQDSSELESGGTKRTIDICKQLEKSVLIVDFSKEFKSEDYSCFKGLLDNFETVNFAGPRESKSPGIYIKVYNYLTKVLV